MKLPELPFLKKKPEEEFFISLIFKPKNIVAILLNNKQSNLSIISTKSVSIDLESATTEEMIVACDEAISSIELSLDEGDRIEKTIFSVPYSWGDSEGSIKKERLAQLKKLSVELALKPMGFILTIEALIKYFQDKEGVPLSAIFVEETKNKVYVYLVKAGNIVEVHSGDITDEVENAVEHTLKKVEKFETLPSKMILLYHDDIETRQQNFLNHAWTKDLPFLHLPQILLMEKGFENEAVIDAIASQINSKISDKVEVAGAEIMEGEGSNILESDENFGFMKEKDAAFVEETKEELDEEVRVNDSLEDDVSDDKDDKAESPNALLSTILGFISKPGKIFAFVGEGKSIPSKFRTLFIPIAAVFAFIFLMAIYYFVFLRVEVVVFLRGEVAQDEVVVALSEEDDTSYEDKILRIDTVEQEVTGTVSRPTTGTEEVGEEATGEVTILSSLNESRSIDAGTVITSSNGLEFTLDESVNIASSSGVSDIKSVEVNVTAADIGREYNLPSDTKFTVEGFSSTSVEAKNEVAFTGGSKEEKQIVSSADVQSLEDALIDELFEDAVNVAREKLGSDEEIISVLLDSSIEGESYSAEVGDETSNLELEGTIVFTLGVYKKDEAEKFINDARGSEAPEGFVISEEDSEIRLDNIEQEDQSITGTLIYEVLYRPDFDFENLAAEVKGKSSKAAEEYIEEIEGVEDASVVFKNKLPLLPSILPVNVTHIDLRLEFQE